MRAIKTYIITKRTIIIKNLSHEFKDLNEVIKFINAEVKSYLNKYNSQQIVFAYNRMTSEELSQEVIIKLLRSVEDPVKGINKSYIRRCITFTCIDIYRKISEHDPVERDDPVITEEDLFMDVERELQMKVFDKRELSIVKLLLEGSTNPDIREILGISRTVYFKIIKEMKIKYTNLIDIESDEYNL